jgi:DNA-directed RNA polymerase specialized sigma24 family protein
MSHRPSLVRRAQQWNLIEAKFTNLNQLLVLAGHCTPATAATEQLLRDLVILAAADDLAGRVVIQRLLPGLMALVRKHNGRSGDDQVLEELIGAAWIAIRTFNPDRHPSCLAAALIGGAEHQAFKAAARRRSASEILADPDEFLSRTAATTMNSEEEMEELLVHARASGLSDEDLLFVNELLSCGSTAVMAERQGVTARTIRNRRNSVTYRLRRCISEDF